jgi:formamidopyrimidine-DNA glycosylase
MPELPEVEVTRLSFVNQIRQATVLNVWLGKPLRWPLGCSVEKLIGQTVHNVLRRGKYLLMQLDDGWLLLHLGMSGALQYAASMTASGPHDHFEMQTSKGLLRLHDPRRFGAVVWVPGQPFPGDHPLLSHLGVEPLDGDFEPLAFHARLKTKKSAIKQVLLSGELVVGVGNIYASEALFWAGIRPSTKASRISLRRATRLHQAIQKVLRRALEVGGSTLKDFSNAQGESGYFQIEMAVYGRQGQPCIACGTAVRQIRQSQRSTYYCPACQKN